MIAKIYNFFQILRSSLSLVPAIFCLGFFVVTLGIYEIEIAYLKDTELPKILFNGSREDAQNVTIALLSSMITMATLAISITMVVLSLAASQLGPRLIKTFMADRKTQCYIGLFFGTVIACFVLTMILHDTNPEDYRPQITITTVFFMCFANLFVLLTFVHHVAETSIADNIILRVSNELIAALDRLTVSEYEYYKENEKGGDDLWPEDFDDDRKRLRFSNHGYVQHIDYDQIAHIACEHDLFIEIHFKSGHFLVEGEDGLRVYPEDKVDEELEQKIKNTFIIGNTRTPTQDIEYSIRHLVEIALRALSPGINDSFTAVSVVNELSAALSRLFQRKTPSEWIMDENEKVRIWAKQTDEADLIFSAFEQIRQNSKDKPGLIVHLLNKLKVLNELAKTDAEKKGIRNQLKEIEFDIKTNLKDNLRDVTAIETLCTQLLNENKK